MGLGVKLGSTAKTICTRVRQDKTKRPIYINTLVKDYLDVYTSLPMNTCEQIAERLEEDGDIASFAMLKEINDEEVKPVHCLTTGSSFMNLLKHPLCSA